jgi:hypothetical protein
MSTTKNIPTMPQFKAVSADLKAAGYEHVCTVMNGDKSSDEYGMRFMRGDSRVWLNMDTFEAVKTMLAAK